MRAAGQWVSAEAATSIGALGGSLLGVWGAVIGALATRGRARTFVLGSAAAVLIVGTLILMTGLLAVLLGQPYAVYFPLLLLGAIVVPVVGGLRRLLPQRHEALEI